MPYDRVNAFGVQHGQVNPAEIMQQQQEAQRRAQMAALMAASGGGSSAPQPASEGFEPYRTKEPEIIGNAGTPYAPIDAFNRETKAGMDMQALQGTQAMDLQKQKGADYLGAVNAQMAPANAEAALHNREYEADLARKAELRKRLDAITGADPNVDASGVTHISELEPDWKPGPANGGYSPYEIMQLSQSIDNGGQLPDIEAKRAQAKYLDLQSKRIDQQTKTGEQEFADSQAEREATRADNTKDYAGANAIRAKAGLANKYPDIANVQADPELMASLADLKKQADGYGSLWAMPTDKNNLAGKITGAEKGALIRGQIDMLMGQFIQRARQKGYDPQQAKIMAIKALQPLMGNDYFPGF